MKKVKCFSIGSNLLRQAETEELLMYKMLRIDYLYPFFWQKKNDLAKRKAERPLKLNLILDMTFRHFCVLLKIY